MGELDLPLFVVRRRSTHRSFGLKWCGGYIEYHGSNNDHLDAPIWNGYTMERELPNGGDWRQIQPRLKATKAGSYLIFADPSLEGAADIYHKKRIWIMMPGPWVGVNHGGASSGASKCDQVTIGGKTFTYLSYGVQIHQGQQPSHSLGCILVGDTQQTTGNGLMIRDSRYPILTSDKIWDFLVKNGVAIAPNKPTRKYGRLFISPLGESDQGWGWLVDEPVDKWTPSNDAPALYQDSSIPQPDRRA